MDMGFLTVGREMIVVLAPILIFIFCAIIDARIARMNAKIERLTALVEKLEKAIK